MFKIDFQQNRMGDSSRNPDETVIVLKQDGLQAAVVTRDLHQVVVDYGRLYYFQDFSKMKCLLSRRKPERPVRPLKQILGTCLNLNRFRGETHAAAEEGPWPRGKVEFFQYQQEVEGHAVQPL